MQGRQYRTVRQAIARDADYFQFDTRVNARLEQGYAPLGGPIVINNDSPRPTLLQALYTDKPNDLTGVGSKKDSV